MSIATIIITLIVALVIAFVAWKVLKGIVKFGLIAVIVIAAAWFVTQGGFA